MRLIDADRLKRELAQMLYDSQLSITGISVSELIDKQSTVDAVPVIRCKDCEFFRDGTDELDAYCAMWGYSPATTPDGYCSDAERREENETD